MRLLLSAGARPSAPRGNHVAEKDTSGDATFFEFTPISYSQLGFSHKYMKRA